MVPKKNEFTFAGNGGWVYHVAVSPDGRYLGSCAGDHTSRIWNIETREPVLTFRSQQCHRLAFSNDGRLVAFADSDMMRVVPLDLSILDRDPALGPDP